MQGRMVQGTACRLPSLNVVQGSTVHLMGLSFHCHSQPLGALQFIRSFQAQQAQIEDSKSVPF